MPDNVRTRDDVHVQALTGSIQLQGILVPLVVREHADGVEHVAGFHRMAAARALGLTDVPVVVRDAETEEADRAMENITRKQLNHNEEAKAVRAMLGRGRGRDFGQDGAAQARLVQGPRHRVCRTKRGETCVPRNRMRRPPCRDTRSVGEVGAEGAAPEFRPERASHRRRRRRSHRAKR